MCRVNSRKANYRHNNNNSIQFNSILVYLCANLTAQRPITKLARVHRNTDITKKQNTNNGIKLIIQFNSIQFKFISVQNLRAHWPITKLARVYIDTEK
jgi:hypothetical protein